MKLRVAVLYGGRSGEHEVSVRSAESVMAVMDRNRYEVVPIFITPEGRWQPGPIVPEPGGNPGIDVVFPVLHGTFGEDGTVQGLLELADLAYVGAGVLASSVSMDKEVMKRLCRESGLPIVDYAVLSRAETAGFECPFPLPVYVKPANMGSSVGISRVARREDLAAALATAAQYDRKLIVEREVAGRELECSVLGNDEPQASLPCEILPSRDFYDYEDKYLLDKARTVVPAEIDGALTAEIRRLAVECYRAVGCAGMARVDFLLDCAANKLYLNEINTIPGFTSISMYPKMWEATGISYSALIDKLIELALERHEEKKTIRYKR
jgi:D-alanine-D-alanine ligase